MSGKLAEAIKRDCIKDEIFHIIHRELWKYNETAKEGEKTYMLDKTIGKMSDKIYDYMEETK